MVRAQVTFVLVKYAARELSDKPASEKLFPNELLCPEVREAPFCGRIAAWLRSNAGWDALAVVLSAPVQL